MLSKKHQHVFLNILTTSEQLQATPVVRF